MSSGPSSHGSPIESDSAYKNVWVIEDDPVYRRRVVDIVNNMHGLQCSLATSNCEEAIALIQEGQKPDIILMDIALAGELNGIDATWEIKGLLPQVHILALTSSDHEQTVSSMIMAGASGYLLKPLSRSEIESSIYQVLRGGTPLTPQIATTVMKLYRENATANTFL